MVEPSGACLVASSPDGPVQVVFLGVVCAGEQVEQSFDLGDGQGDESGVGGWLFIRAVRQDRLGCLGSLFGDGADGEGGHGEHDVAIQSGVVADLAVIEPEVVLAELEVLLDGPP